MRRPRRRASVGTRLAAVTALLVIAVGVTLLTTSYWLLVVRLPHAVSVDTAVGTTRVPLTSSGADDGTTLPLTVTPPGDPSVRTPDVSAGARVMLPGDVDALVSSVARDSVLNYQLQLRRSFAKQSALLLAALTVMSIAVGWFAARRALRPVQVMTETARRLGAESLEARLPTDGPRDELAELAETFNAMLDRVESAFRRERRLMANVSHELRTPLANQRVVLEVGLEDSQASPFELRRIAEQALTQNLRAERLITQLLALARAEQAKPGESDGEVTDLADVARQAVHAVRALPQGTPGIDVRLALEPAVILGSAVLLDRLVGNLVENAFRHNVPGGVVSVSTSTVTARSWGAGAPFGRLVVENSGPLVPADVLPSLFEPFRRGVDSTGDRVRSDRGTGLGLSIVTAVVTRYGGRLDARPRPEGGLRITVSLPGPRTPLP